jgi:hypothetical protein
VSIASGRNYTRDGRGSEDMSGGDHGEALARSRVEQNCVLRGFGHQTAPTREMLKTQANAMGSLLERIATLSPGSTPARSSARATRQGTRCTSASDISLSPW